MLKVVIFIWHFQMSQSHFWDKSRYHVSESPRVYCQHSVFATWKQGLSLQVFQELSLDSVPSPWIICILPLSANSQKVMILFSLQRCSLSESQSPCTITRCSMDGFVSQEEVPNLSDQAHAEHSLRVAKSKLSCADNQELTTVIHKGKREVLWLCTYT